MAKKQDNRVETILNAATGYGVVVLSIVCFILALVIVVTAVRIVVGAGHIGGSAATSANVTATAIANSVTPHTPVPSRFSWEVS